MRGAPPRPTAHGPRPMAHGAISPRPPQKARSSSVSRFPLRSPSESPALILVRPPIRPCATSPVDRSLAILPCHLSRTALDKGSSCSARAHAHTPPLSCLSGDPARTLQTLCARGFSGTFIPPDRGPSYVQAGRRASDRPDFFSWTCARSSHIGDWGINEGLSISSLSAAN